VSHCIKNSKYRRRFCQAGDAPVGRRGQRQATETQTLAHRQTGTLTTTAKMTDDSRQQNSKRDIIYSERRVSFRQKTAWIIAQRCRQQKVVVEDHYQQLWSVDFTPRCGSSSVADHMNICPTIQ